MSRRSLPHPEAKPAPALSRNETQGRLHCIPQHFHAYRLLFHFQSSSIPNLHFQSSFILISRHATPHQHLSSLPARPERPCPGSPAFGHRSPLLCSHRSGPEPRPKPLEIKASLRAVASRRAVTPKKPCCSSLRKTALKLQLNHKPSLFDGR